MCATRYMPEKNWDSSHLQSSSDMKEWSNSVLSHWTVFCCNYTGSGWSQFSLNFWYFAQWPDLTTKCFLGLPVEKHGGFEDKTHILTCVPLESDSAHVSTSFWWDNKEPKRNIRYCIHLLVSWRWAGCQEEYQHPCFNIVVLDLQGLWCQ